MTNTNKVAPLTEARIRRILELESELLRRTRKDAKKFLAIPRLPDVAEGETFTDVISPRMADYFSGWDEDPAGFLKDRERLLMIYSAVKGGGVRAVIERHKLIATGSWLNSAIKTMEEKGLGNPVMVRQLLPQMKAKAENIIRRLESVGPEEEQAVRNCLKDIEDNYVRHRKT